MRLMKSLTITVHLWNSALFGMFLETKFVIMVVLHHFKRERQKCLQQVFMLR